MFTIVCICIDFCFSSRRRHTRCALVIGVQTCALPIFATASIYPPGQLVKGIIVNRLGKRFVAEDSDHGRTASFIMGQPQNRAYLIVDSEIFAYPEITSAKHALIDGYESVAAMEEGLELPRNALVQTLDRYNMHAAKGRDPLFEKHADWLKPLDAGPWAAFDISLDRSTYYYITLGGLSIVPHATVFDRSVDAGKEYREASCAARLCMYV